MLGQMIGKLLLLDKTLRATSAFIRFDHVMLGYMNLKMLTSVKFLRAYVTEILLTFVYLNVS